VIVRSARPAPGGVPLERGGWVTNKADLTVSRFFGFGLMDAGKMVYLAEHWTKVPEQRRCEMKGEDENRFDAICISVKSLLELVTRIFAIWAKVAHMTTRVPGWDASPSQDTQILCY